ncbi:MAG: sensor histidine kinase, partial [Campylobacterales bacterium]
FDIESSFKILFHEYGSNQEKFSRVEKFIQKEQLHQIDEYIKTTNNTALVILIDGNLAYSYPKLPSFQYDFLEQIVTEGKSTLKSTEKTYIVKKTEFVPWKWEIYVLKNQAVLQKIILDNKKLVLSIIASIIVFIILFLILIVWARIKKPLSTIIKKLEKIRDGKYETIDMSSSFEMDTLAQHINATSSIIEEREEDIKEQLKYTKGILEAQESIVVIADGSGVRDANKAFFDTFSEFDNLEEFKKEHSCICDFFVETGLEGYIGEVDKQDTFELYKKISKDKSKTYKVCMKIDEVKKYFSIKVNILIVNKDELFIVVLTDISEAEKYRLHLEERIEQELEKNRESEKRIYRLKKEKSLSELLTNIAHQWRQPLNSISLSLNEIDDMIEFEELEKDRAKYIIERTTSEIEYISNIITILTQLKPNYEQREIFCIDSAIISATDSMKKELNQEGFELNLRLNGSKIFGERRKLLDVLTKMIKNSIDQAIIQKSAERTLDICSNTHDNEVEIKLEDSCGGVAEDVLENIFDPYITTGFKSRGK